MVKIKEIPIEDRPCERLILNGAEALSNEELLAIIFKSGSKGNSSKDLSSKVLSDIKYLKKLNELDYEFFKKYKGIGKFKACSLLASIELGKRINEEISNIRHIKLNCSSLVYEFYKNKIGNKKQEYFYCVYLDNNKNVIKDKLLFIGTLNYSLVHPREIFKEAYLIGASAIICVHNHPSSNVLPSKQDYEVTNNLIQVGKVLGIKILDHIIIGQTKYYSFLENNDISF